jgi:hypothetical protein
MKMLRPNQSIVWVVGVLLAAMPQLASAQRPDASEVGSAIERLWSADEAQARAAKEQLVGLGVNSVQPVTSLLSGIWKDGQKRHFARGKEHEGAIAWARHEAGADDGEEFWRFEITSRLIYDTCEILGRLGAVESVPVLMEVVESENQFGGFMKETPAVHALKIIGKPAAPYILSRFLLAADEELRVRMQIGPSHWALTRTDLLEHRAAQLLIAIGDDSVLPVLRSLLDKTQYPNASGHAKNAIGMIERGEGRRTSFFYPYD